MRKYSTFQNFLSENFKSDQSSWKNIAKKFIFSEVEGHQVTIFIKKGAVLGDAIVFSVHDRNTSSRNTF